MRLFTFILFFFLTLTAGAQHHDADYYIKQAKANSPLINRTQNENKIAGLDLEQLKRSLSKPEINLEAGILFSPVISHDNGGNRLEVVSKDVINYNGYDMAMTDGGQYQSVVSLKQPLFTGSSVRTYENKTNVSRQINENVISLTEHELERVVVQQYIVCLKTKKSVDLSRELLTQAEDNLRLMKKLVENAVYSESDLMILRIENDNYRLGLETFLSDYKNNLADLNILCGIADTAFVDLPDINLQLNKTNTSTSSFLTAYFLDSLNILANQSVFELKYKPQLDFFANAGLNAVYLPAFNRLGVSTGLTFSWNIFDGWQRNIQMQKSEISKQSIDFEKRNFIRQQDGNLKNIDAQLKLIDNKILLITNQIIQYTQLIQVYNARLMAGEIPIMDYKNLLKDYAAKKHNLIVLGLEKQSLISYANFWNY